LLKVIKIGPCSSNLQLALEATRNALYKSTVTTTTTTCPSWRVVSETQCTPRSWRKDKPKIYPHCNHFPLDQIMKTFPIPLWVVVPNVVVLSQTVWWAYKLSKGA